MFKDENKEKDDIVLSTNLRAAYISTGIMSFLIVFNFFCALSPFGIELLGILLTTVYLFVYIKFTVICEALKDIGYKKCWLKFYRTIGLALYLISQIFT